MVKLRHRLPGCSGVAICAKIAAVDMLARNRKLAIDRIDIGMGTIMAGEASCTCHCWIIVIHGRWCPAVGVVVAGGATR